MGHATNEAYHHLFKGTVRRIIDGDTIDVLIRWDIGFKVTCETHQRLRLAGINAPEVRGPERAYGLAASAWLSERIPVGSQVWLRTDKSDAFGRYVAEVYDGEGTERSINVQMVEAGHALFKDY